MERAYIGVGGNLGDRVAYLEGACAALEASEQIELLARSRTYETAPVGPPGQGPYLNAVVCLETSLEPRALLERLQTIETAAGRVRGHVRNAPRTIDLDILLYGDWKLDEEGLSVPHPRMHERGFVLEPLAEVAPQLLHPVLGETIAALAERVRDPDAVWLFAESR